jgi:hypothetical protein
MINSVVFAVLFILFCCYRKVRTRKVLGADVPKVALYESEWSLLALLIHVYEIDANQMQELCGSPAVLFLKLHKMIIALLALLNVLAFAILVPMYSIGTASVTNDLNTVSFAHIRDSEDLMVGPVLCFLVFAALGQGLLYAFFKFTHEGER